MEDTTYRDLYGKLTAFVQKLYEAAQATEPSIRRQLHYAEQSQSKTIRENIPQIQGLLREREVMIAMLELILRKTHKEETLSRLSDEDRALFEAVYRSPEGQRYVNS